MIITDKFGNKKKVPTINPISPINRFEGQSKVAKFLNKNLLLKMDYFTNIRSTFIIITLSYLLGKNLNLFLNVLFIVHCYLLFYRLIRFWVERWLMFMIDFCYIGNFLLDYIILFDRKNLNLFITEFSISNSIISFAAIVCDNQADLSNTDFLTSCSIHLIPIISMWAIKWRNRIYSYNNIENSNKENSNIENNNFFNYNIFNYNNSEFINLDNVKFKFFDEIFMKIFFFSYGIWFIWAIIYFILCTTILRKFTYSDLYQSAVGDFYKSKDFEFIFGDHTKNTAIKFLCMHFIFLIIVTPLMYLNFYSFHFNTFYLIFLIVFLGYNQSKKSQIKIREVVNEAEKQIKN